VALNLRGINYDAGTEFLRGKSSRRHWQLDDVELDLRAIRDALGCNSVAVYGTSLPRIQHAASIALDLGLHVSMQLRSIDLDKSATLANMVAAARAAREPQAPDRVFHNLGCECTLFTHGFLPGKTFLRRIANLRWSWPCLIAANPMLALTSTWLATAS
jgi:hypothetical protein